ECLDWLARVTSVADSPYVCCVVGASGWSYVRVFEKAFFDRQLLAHVCGHEHDVDQSLMSYFADDVEKLREVAVAILVACPDFRRKLRGTHSAGCEITAWAGGSHAKGHVGVFGIGDDESARGAICFYFG